MVSQVRTAEQTELARLNLRRLRASTDVLMIEPVPYEKVRGVGFYRQFLNPSEWPAFMRSGRSETRRALRAYRPERGERSNPTGRPYPVSKTKDSSVGTGVSSWA